jgi:hypothetical protein
MFAMTKQVDVIKRWVDGPDVLTWFELRTPPRTRWPSSTGPTSKPDSSPGSA